MLVDITPEKARIYRITHRDNIPGILDRGLICRNEAGAAEFRNIGDLDLIDKRSRHPVPVPPGGMLSDYVPFYFTHASPMLYKIVTGYGISRCPRPEIVFAVTSLHLLLETNIKFVSTDRHALLAAARFSDDLGCLDRIDWDILQRKDFKRDPEDPEKLERYQAECLVYRKVPLAGLLGFACYDVQTQKIIKDDLAARGIKLPVAVRSEWYF